MVAEQRIETYGSAFFVDQAQDLGGKGVVVRNRRRGQGQQAQQRENGCECDDFFHFDFPSLLPKFFTSDVFIYMPKRYSC